MLLSQGKEKNCGNSATDSQSMIQVEGFLIEYDSDKDGSSDDGQHRIDSVIRGAEMRVEKKEADKGKKEAYTADQCPWIVVPDVFTKCDFRHKGKGDDKKHQADRDGDDQESQGIARNLGAFLTECEDRIADCGDGREEKCCQVCSVHIYYFDSGYCTKRG